MSLFDSKFTKQTPIDSPTDGSMLSSSANQVFYVSMKSICSLYLLHLLATMFLIYIRLYCLCVFSSVIACFNVGFMWTFILMC